MPSQARDSAFEDDGSEPCTGLKVPHRHRPVVGARDDVPPVRAERHGSHHTGVPSQFVQPGTGLDVPHRHAVVAARDEAPPVRAERHGNHHTGVPSQFVQPGTGRRSHTATVQSSEPETRRRPSGLNATAVTRAGARSVRAAGHRSEVPHRHGPVVGAGDEAPPVRAERHGSHRSLVPGQFVQPGTGLDVRTPPRSGRRRRRPGTARRG